MKLEEQVCTLEQGEKLQELGVKENSFLSFFGDEYQLPEGVEKHPVWIATTTPINSFEADQRADINTTKPIAPAYTVAELGEMLPDEIEVDGKCPMFNCNKTEDGWECYYKRNIHVLDPIAFIFEFPTEAQARAAMLIHLIENGIVQPFETSEA